MIELTITSTALIIVVITLRHFLKGRISLRLQYALWALVLVRLLVPVYLSQSPISVLNAVRTGEPAAAFSQSVPQGVMPEGFMNSPQADNNTPLNRNAVPESHKTALDWGQVIRMAWYTGIAVVGLCLVLSNLSFYRKLRMTRIEFHAEAYRLKVYLVNNLPSPCLYGLFSPAVYITPEVAGDKTRLLHVLTHERSHYRHGDHIWSALRSVCLAVYWFNPFVWLAAGISRRDAELSCDEATIMRLGEENRMEYGRTLIGLTSLRRTAMDLLCCATAMTDSKRGIKERIVLLAKKPKTAVCMLAAVMVILAVAAGCTFTGAKTEEAAPSAGTPSAETTPVAESPAAVTDTLTYRNMIYDGKKPLSKEELQKATSLTIINVDSLDFLRDAPNLKYLTAGTGSFYEDAESVSGDIGALGGLENLQSINMNYSNVTGDISSLSGLDKLQILYLSMTRVSGDISALKGLEKLTDMSVASEHVTGDLGALKGLPALVSFDLSGKGITGDLSAMAGHSHLKRINLYSTPNITGNIRMLKEMHLDSIQFTETSIAIDLSALSDFTELISIDLASDNITGSLSDLSGIFNLMNISLSGKKIAGDLSDLSGMSQLQFVNLQCNEITGDLSTLSGLSKLQYLTLSGVRRVTGDIGMLKECVNLTSIILDETNIEAQLSALSGFSRLTSIALYSPNVSGDLNDLSGLKMLSRIVLTSPNVTGNISTLSSQNNLTQLRLNCPKITGDIGALGKRKQLTLINLSTANVSGDIGALSGLTKLNNLNLSSTGVTGDIGALDGLEELKETDVTGTKVTGSKST